MMVELFETLADLLVCIHPQDIDDIWVWLYLQMKTSIQ